MIRSALLEWLELKKPKGACRTGDCAVTAAPGGVTLAAQERLRCPSAMCPLLLRVLTAGAAPCRRPAPLPGVPSRAGSTSSLLPGAKCVPVSWAGFARSLYKCLTPRLLPKPRDVCCFHPQVVLHGEPLWLPKR